MRSLFIGVMLVLATANAAAQTRDLDEAKRRFEAGSKAFAKGDYLLAEQEFRAAFDITGDPILHFNIAEAQAQQRHYEEAIQSYRSYLAGVPNADDRAEVERRIRDFEAKLKQKPGPVAGGERKPTGGAPGGSRRIWAWTTAGSAVALLAVGAAMSALGAKARSNGNDLLTARDAQGRPLSFADVASKYDGYKHDAALYGKVGITMYVLAAAAAATSIYLFVSSGGEGAKERPQARLRLAPVLSWQGAGLVAGAEF